VTYAVKELFYSLQGEGAQAGCPAVFCRFAGCNLWNGREKDRQGAICKFCDTDFRGTDGSLGGSFQRADELGEIIRGLWPGDPHSARHGLVVLTGGEPLLQVDAPLIAELQSRGFAVAIETNGTLPAPDALDWVCVSPKAGAPLVQRRGNELKVVYPQPGLNLEELQQLEFDHFFLQPMDGPSLAKNMEAAVAYCLAHPEWRLSLQTHKALGIP
jgi:7-carboxy-7-deazaguanine synthase (Cx14CxxC type)